MENKKLFFIALIAQSVCAVVSGIVVFIAIQTGSVEKMMSPFFLVVGTMSAFNFTLMFKGLKKKTFIKGIYVFIMVVCILLMILGMLGMIGVLPI